jgi:arylsulfatase A-like enzyme
VIAAALRRTGYETIHIGKYLNGYGYRTPTYVPPGWSDWLGSVDPSTYRYYRFTLNENGKLHTFGAHAYQTTVYARLAVNRIRREADRPGPFFLDLAFLAPHAVERETSGLDPADLKAAGAPHSRSGIRFPVPARRDIGRFKHKRLPDQPAFDEADVGDKPPNIRIRPRFNAAEVAEIKHSYRARLETLLAVDRAVVRIIHALAATHQLDNTVVVFTSDNGFFHGEHRVPDGKYLPYEPSIRVPLVVRGPGVAVDATSSALVSNVDLPATIIDLAGADPLRRLDGRSLVPVLADPSVGRVHDAVLVESGKNPIGAPVYHGVRTRRYLYVEYEDGFRELYDLRHDPFQLRNEARAPAQRSVERRLARRLHRAEACAGQACP